MNVQLPVNPATDRVGVPLTQHRFRFARVEIGVPASSGWQSLRMAFLFASGGTAKGCLGHVAGLRAPAVRAYRSGQRREAGS